MKYSILFFTLLSYIPFAQSQSGCSLRTSGLSAAAVSATPADISKMNRYDVHFYKLDLTVQNNSVYMSGHAEMRAKVLQPIANITLQLHENLTIDSILLNNDTASYTRATDILTVNTNGILNANALFNLVIYYHGNAPSTGQGAIGNGFSNNAAKKVTWSLSEPYSAYEWWPCKQVLTDKADSAEVWITTDTINKAGSNGLLKNTVALGNGKVRYEWKTTYPIAYYLISVAVCPYNEFIQYAHPAGADSILIQNYLYKTTTEAERAGINRTPELIELYSAKYGLYPFAKEKYGHTEAVFGGAMEHQTMSTMGDIGFGVVSHELAHQWFGDMVTCGSWADIWLNEGFASYSEMVALENLVSIEEATNWMSDAMNMARAAQKTVFVNDSLNVPDIFSYFSTYKKGAVLLHMLRYEINNDSLFFLGMRNYLQAHKYNTARATNFKQTMEQTSGKNFTAFFNQWYYNPGYPVLSGQWNQWQDNIWIQLNQTPSEASTVFTTPIDVKLLYDGGDTTIRIQLDAPSKLFKLIVPGKTIYRILIDPDGHILHELFSMNKNLALDAQQNIQHEFDNLLTYPNPVQHTLTITGAKGCFIYLTDITGKQLAVYQLNTEKEEVDCAWLPTGLYMLQVWRNGAVTHQKFFKN